MVKKIHNNNDFDLALEVGEIKGLIRGICERLDKQNGAVADIVHKVQRHEIFFGKIGIIVTVVGVFITTATTLAVSWIKEKIL